jgi:hypothetical protein
MMAHLDHEESHSTKESVKEGGLHDVNTSAVAAAAAAAAAAPLETAQGSSPSSASARVPTVANHHAPLPSARELEDLMQSNSLEL